MDNARQRLEPEEIVFDASIEKQAKKLTKDKHPTGEALQSELGGTLQFQHCHRSLQPGATLKHKQPFAFLQTQENSIMNKEALHTNTSIKSANTIERYSW